MSRRLIWHTYVTEQYEVVLADGEEGPPDPEGDEADGYDAWFAEQESADSIVPRDSWVTDRDVSFDEYEGVDI